MKYLGKITSTYDIANKGYVDEKMNEVQSLLQSSKSIKLRDIPHTSEYNGSDYIEETNDVESFNTGLDTMTFLCEGMTLGFTVYVGNETDLSTAGVFINGANVISDFVLKDNYLTYTLSPTLMTSDITVSGFLTTFYFKDVISIEDIFEDLKQDIKNTKETLTAHIEDKNNPHDITVTQIGAASLESVNVENEELSESDITVSGILQPWIFSGYYFDQPGTGTFTIPALTKSTIQIELHVPQISLKIYVNNKFFKEITTGNDYYINETIYLDVLEAPTVVTIDVDCPIDNMWGIFTFPSLIKFSSLKDEFLEHINTPISAENIKLYNTIQSGQRSFTWNDFGFECRYEKYSSPYLNDSGLQLYGGTSDGECSFTGTDGCIIGFTVERSEAAEDESIQIIINGENITTPSTTFTRIDFPPTLIQGDIQVILDDGAGPKLTFSNMTLIEPIKEDAGNVQEFVNALQLTLTNIQTALNSILAAQSNILDN